MQKMQTLNLGSMPGNRETLELLKLHIEMHYEELDHGQLMLYKWVAYMLEGALLADVKNIEMSEIVAEAFEMSDKAEPPVRGEVADAEYEQPEMAPFIIRGLPFWATAKKPADLSEYPTDPEHLVTIVNGPYAGQQIDSRHAAVNLNDDLVIFRPALAKDMMVLKTSPATSPTQYVSELMVATGWVNFKPMSMSYLEGLKVAAFNFLVNQFSEFNDL